MKKIISLIAMLCMYILSVSAPVYADSHIKADEAVKAQETMKTDTDTNKEEEEEEPDCD